jgi:hypothetical protein
MRSAHNFVSQVSDLEDSYYPDGLTESTIDALLASVDRELAAATAAANLRVTHTFTDARSAHRATRRAGRTVLRSLPVQLGTSDLFEGEAA